jgi:O-antigen ligase
MAAANKIKLIDISFWCFVLGVVLLPVGLGGNRLLPLGLMQGAFALACFGYVCAHKKPPEPRLFLRLRVALGLFALVVLWAWLQMQSFVPVAWMHPLWLEAADVLGRHLGGAIALSPEDSLIGLNRLITYIAAGFLAFLFGQEPKRARQVVAELWWSGVAICAYGLIEHVLGLRKVLWFDKWAYQDDLSATFVNRNDFAIYAGLVLMSGATLLVQSWKEQVKARSATARTIALRDWLGREGIVRVLLLLAVFLGIVLSHSRAGLTLDVLGLGSYFFFYQIYKQNWGRAILTALIASVVLALVLALAWQYSDRFAHLFVDYSSADRLKVYKLTLRAIGDNPWLGYGLNGFEPVFRLYQRGMIMEFTHAHSDVLESLLDLGIPVGLMMWGAIALLVSGLVRGIVHRRRHGMFPCLGLAASVIVLLHATIDFSLQIPGVAGRTWPCAKLASRRKRAGA